MIELYDAACMTWHESYLMLEIPNMFPVNESSKIPSAKNISDFILATSWRQMELSCRVQRALFG